MRDLALVPGTLCDARLFDAAAALLPEWRRWDIDMSRHDRVEDAAVAALERCTERFLCVGFSMGGFVALEMLRRAPSRIAGLVLVAGNAHPDRPENAVARRADAALARAIGMESFVAGKAAEWGIAGLPAVLRVVADMAAAAGPDVLARQGEMNIFRPDLRAVVREAQVPVLVMAGGRDPLCPPERYAAAASGPAGTLVTLAGAGHYLPLEEPAAVAAAIRRFAAAVAPAEVAA